MVFWSGVCNSGVWWSFDPPAGMLSVSTLCSREVVNVILSAPCPHLYINLQKLHGWVHAMYDMAG